jgi:hypothetical protein
MSARAADVRALASAESSSMIMVDLKVSHTIRQATQQDTDGHTRSDLTAEFAVIDQHCRHVSKYEAV